MSVLKHVSSEFVPCTSTLQGLNSDIYSRHVGLMKVIVFLLLCFLYSTSVTAQCRNGSGPDFGDGIPYCSQVAPPARPLQVVDRAAAVASGENEGEILFVGVEKYDEEAAAVQAAIGNCRKLGWANCKIIASVTSGVIAIARDAEGGLRSRRDETFRQAKMGLLEYCKRANTKCKIEATFDGREVSY
jgi:hypothetical protein